MPEKAPALKHAPAPADTAGGAQVPGGERPAYTSPSEQDRFRRFTDRFRGTRVLKAGLGGETLRGIDASDGREVVIRTMTDADPSADDRLEQKLARFDRLEGTGLVRPLAAGRQGAVLYSVVPYVPGVTLEAHLAGRSEPLTVAEALADGRGILQPLAEAHEHRFLHRDVRPSNVVVGVSAGRIERATLVDFGSFSCAGWPDRRSRPLGCRPVRLPRKRRASWPTTSTSARISTPPGASSSSAWPVVQFSWATPWASCSASTSPSRCPGCAASVTPRHRPGRRLRRRQLRPLRAGVQPRPRRRLLLSHPRPDGGVLRRGGGPPRRVHRHPLTRAAGGGVHGRAGRRQPPADRAIRGGRAAQGDRSGNQRDELGGGRPPGGTRRGPPPHRLAGRARVPDPRRPSLVASPTESWHLDDPERFATFRRVTRRR